MAARPAKTQSNGFGINLELLMVGDADNHGSAGQNPFLKSERNVTFSPSRQGPSSHVHPHGHAPTQTDHARRGASSKLANGSRDSLFAQKHARAVLPKLGTGPLQLHAAPSALMAAAASPTEMGSITFSPQESTHSFVQHTWSTFSNMSDAHRNQLLKGILGRCSSKQIEMICTCLNLKTIDTSTPGHQVPPKIMPEDVVGKYAFIKHKKYSRGENDKDGGVSGTFGAGAARGANNNTTDDPTRRAIAGGSISGAASTGESASYMNANIYIKLLNSTIDPDLIPKQLARAGPEGTRFLITFLANRCKKLQSILQTMYSIALEIEMEKAMNMLLNCALDATEARYACLYITGQTPGKLTIRNSNWPAPRETVSTEDLFASSMVFKGERVNVYSVKTSELYTDAVADAYQQVEPECILSAPVFGNGMKVCGLIEVVNKRLSNPFFNAEDEFMIKALASLGTLLFNHPNVKQNAVKKTDDIKVFLNTASIITSEKADMGDLIHVIMQTARELVSAERCALFMLDREKEELWTSVAQGTAEIRIPMNKGIAGHVAMTGETLNIPDAYADSRFNREVDMRTGFRTRNILCMPMYDQHQEIIGVTQVINKLPEQMAFTKEDEVQLASFSSLAASTIEKQLAFENLHGHLQEMTRSRTYMSAMLQSMNSVVMNINEDGQLVSINNPERMGFTPMLSTMRLTSFEHWLGHDNSQIVDDITRAQASLMPLTGRNFPLVVTNQPIRYINYFIRQIQYDAAVDRLMEPRKSEPSSRINTGKKHKKPEEQIPEKPEATGILLIMDEITSDSSLEESVGRQMTTAAMHRLMDDRAKLQGENLKVTVLVADIRSFNTAVEGLSPYKKTQYLNSFYETVAEAVQAENGIITKISGDSATAVFGLPTPSSNDTRRAVSAALRIRHAVDELEKKHQENELPGIRVGVGIATGEALCAAIGPPRAQEYTVVGDPILLAHRLEEISKVYGIPVMASDRCRDEVKELFHAREIDITPIRGFANAMTVYEIMASSERDLQHDVMTTLICYELGLSEYRAKNWQASIMHFKKAIALSDDRPSRTFIERCRGLIDGKFEVPEEWDCVWRVA